MTMARRLLLLISILASAGGCDDEVSGGPTSPVTTTTTIPQPAKASVALRVARVEPELSPVRGMRFRLTWHITLTETAGVGARVSILRQEIWNRDFDQYERTEIGENEIPGVCGTRILHAGSEWQCRAPFDFNLSNFEGLIRLTVALYDDFDNLIVLTINVPLSETGLAARS
jgi:hypothetical protein